MCVCVYVCVCVCACVRNTCMLRLCACTRPRRLECSDFLCVHRFSVKSPFLYAKISYIDTENKILEICLHVYVNECMSVYVRPYGCVHVNTFPCELPGM